MKKLLFLFSCICSFYLSHAQSSASKDYLHESKAEKDQRMQWWRDARFGMFIHWGVYAVPAGYYKGKEVKGIGEWIMHNAKIPIPEYEAFARQFDPTQFNADDWVRIAKNAGMKYIIITSKHHDGFCMWNSQLTNYDIVDFTPYKKDVLKQLAEACRKQGIRLGFYYSIMDWHHPDADSAHFARYRDNYLIPQLKELLGGNYGNVSVLWFDGEWIKEWTEDQGRALYNTLRNIKPDLIINNRIGKGRMGMKGMNKDASYVGDFGTPEQEILQTASALDWESCMTMNDTWGFKKNDHHWKTAQTLIRNLVDIVAKGGNYLLNIGPTSEGLIPDASVERLAEMGKWLKVNGEAIYATRSLQNYAQGDSIRFTQSKDGRYLYAIVMNRPSHQLTLQQVIPAPHSRVTLLGYKGKLNWKKTSHGITLALPAVLRPSERLPLQYAYVLKIKMKKADG